MSTQQEVVIVQFLQERTVGYRYSVTGAESVMRSEVLMSDNSVYTMYRGTVWGADGMARMVEYGEHCPALDWVQSDDAG